jgi:hypothetical protein
VDVVVGEAIAESVQEAPVVIAELKKLKSHDRPSIIKAIIEARGCYSRQTLAPYDRRLRARFGVPKRVRIMDAAVPYPIGSTLAPALFSSRWFVRHVLLDRWFLHAHERSLAAAA